MLSSTDCFRAKTGSSNADTRPQFISQIFTEKRPLNMVAVGAVSGIVETVGLSVVLIWWGTRTTPFE